MLTPSLTNYALTYLQYGYAVIATDEYKRPAVNSWKEYQKQKPDKEVIVQMFNNDRVKGLGVICGEISGQLEVIDIDTKYDLSGKLFEDFMAEVQQADTSLASKLLIATTINRGYHIYYRCENVAGNQKLASRPTTVEEQKDNPHHKVVVLIETRGEGGYVVAAPSPGYKFIHGKPNACPLISTTERDTLLDIARSFNQYYEKTSQYNHLENKLTKSSEYISVFDDYDKRVDMKELLTSYGWTVVMENEKKIFFKRPGNSQSIQSGNFNKELGWFSVFTSSSIFQEETAYKPYAVYAKLECEDNFKLAARKLSKLGYGSRNGSTNGHMKHDALLGPAPTDGISIKRFWEVNHKSFAVNIIQHKLEQFLSEEGGFYLYFYNSHSSIFKLIRNKRGIIEETSREQIKKFVKEYVLNLPEHFDGILQSDLQEAIYKKEYHYFRDSFYEFLQPIHIDLLKDTEHITYFPFSNGVVCITKDGYELKGYEQLGKSIWRSQIINYNISLYNNDNPMTFIVLTIIDLSEKYAVMIRIV